MSNPIEKEFNYLKALSQRDALIRELVAALVHMLIQPAPDTDYARRIIAKAKAQGYEP